MIRLRYLSGTTKGKIYSSDKAVIRLGCSVICDVRFDSATDPEVSHLHAMIVTEDASIVFIDTESGKGSFINGTRVTRQVLQTGDSIALGAPDGTKLEFDPQDGPRVRSAQTRPPDEDEDDPPEAQPRKPGRTASTTDLAEQAARRVAAERVKAGSESSGQTRFIIADALQQMQNTTESASRREWTRVILGVAGLFLLVTGLLSAVVYQQKRQIDQLVQNKQNLDKSIQAVLLRQTEETNPEKLQQLEQELALLTGNAQQTLKDLAKSNQKKAEELEEAGDQLDRDIRDILKKFGAPTYVVPPIFKQTLRKHIDSTLNLRSLKEIYRRKKQYWPMISRELGSRGLPEEIGYIAWTESYFNPDPGFSTASARGMWQFIEATARRNGLTVTAELDERINESKATVAAAHYIAVLMNQFGEHSFMLAIASYNMGEDRLRRVLDRIIDEPGTLEEKHDFWHLYRLKKLPEETREYVPAVLAAAIICSHPERYGLEP